MKVQAAVTRAKHSDMSIETLALEAATLTSQCVIRHFPCHSP
jgi:hypothetical protein